MKNDLRSFLKGSNAANGRNAQSSGNASEPQLTPATIQQVAEKYAGKSQNELFAELKRNIAEQKANGTYSSEALSRFAAMAAPMMTQEQKQKMHELLRSL